VTSNKDRKKPRSLPPIEFVDVERLALDDQNPRLPEALQGASEQELLQYLFETGVLSELAVSMTANGYFVNEPLVALKELSHGKHVVIEGNRRLATVKVMLGDADASGEGLRFDDDLQPTSERQEELRALPVYLVDSRDDVRGFLGFRHIGGLKEWGPEAKARYIVQQVDRVIQEGAEDPYKVISREVGVAIQTVRNSYLALRLLRYGREEFGIPTDHLQTDRFGVWVRTMSSKDVLGYVGLQLPRKVSDIESSFAAVSESRLREVLSDLTPSEGEKKALLADSRDVTKYGQVLASEKARSILRRTRSLAIAKDVIEQAAIPSRIRRLAELCTSITDEVGRSELGDDAVSAAEDLVSQARTLRAAVAERMRDDND
jgi:hypothetical protein